MFEIPTFLPSLTVSRPFVITATLILLAYLIVPLFIRRNLKDKDGCPLPPGPLLRYPCLPKYPEIPVHAWAQKYGPIMSVWTGTQLFVVVNDMHVARDLFVTHGANFSGRWNYFIKQTVLRGGSITGATYGDIWRQHRRIAMWLLNPKAIQGYSKVLDYEAHIFLRSLHEAGSGGKAYVNPAVYSGRYALNNMLTVTLGMRTLSDSDPLTQKALELGHEFMQITGPWTNAIDFIPFLQWIPSDIKSRAQRLHDEFFQVYGAIIDKVRERIERGDDVPDCLVKSLIECREKENLSWHDMCFITNAFTTGGVHSTAGVIQWFIALLPSHPDVQAKAHEELDRVVGQSHWPTSEDAERLPYLRAIIKELLRLHPPFWMGTPHSSMEDFTYNGMFIPKDTTMILNVYSLHHNEERYPDSYSFIPERYLGDDLGVHDSAKQTDVSKRDHFAFGAGRRLCPATILAERELWLVISRILWCFTVYEKPGAPISLREYEGKSGRTPLPFDVQMVPRHSGVVEMLETEQEQHLKY